MQATVLPEVGRESSSPGAQLEVLVVDDDATVRRAVAKVVESLGIPAAGRATVSKRGRCTGASTPT